MDEETENEGREQETAEKKDETRTLTQEEINKLIEAARKQEKDKLYDTISSLRDQVSTLADERKQEKAAREKAEKEAQERAEAERVAKLSTEDRVSEQLKNLEERLAREAKERETLKAELDRERQQAELERFKASLLQGETDIIPELVNGASKEEIQASIATAKAKYQQYFQAAVTKAEGSKKKPEGLKPADPDLDALDEQDLQGLRGLSRPDMTTGSMKSREEIIAAKNKGVSPEYLKQKNELLDKVGDLYRKTVRG